MTTHYYIIGHAYIGSVNSCFKSGEEKVIHCCTDFTSPTEDDRGILVHDETMGSPLKPDIYVDDPSSEEDDDESSHSVQENSKESPPKSGIFFEEPPSELNQIIILFMRIQMGHL